VGGRRKLIGSIHRTKLMTRHTIDYRRYVLEGTSQV
jgi:hypothetical protein